MKSNCVPGSVVRGTFTAPFLPHRSPATDLRVLFTSAPNFAPYNSTPIALDGAASAAWRQMTAGLDFSKPDGNELRLRQAIAIAAGIPRRKPGKERK
jgi:hypothetical protein